jgi:hypothetical protein
MELEKGYLPVEIPGGKIGFVASYSVQKLVDYMNNPLIEALPPILSVEEAIESIALYPDIEEVEKERGLSAALRLHCVGRLKRFVEPTVKHVSIEEKISRCIRDGYISRNPLGKEHIMKLQAIKQAIVTKKEITELQWEGHSTADGFTIIGISGMGKTTAIERILSLYPQIIVHSKYKDTGLSFYQLPYLKLDCPEDGSLGALCIDFFDKVDYLLGTNYRRKFTSRRETIPVMSSSMAQVAMVHSLGILVIDEIQNLSVAGVGYEKTLNYLVKLVNMLGVPVVLIGTPKATKFVSSAFREGRRGGGQGDVTWDRMEKDEDWGYIIETMWHYQWTKVNNELTDELKNVIYEESQGIVDIAVKLYMLAQIEVIGRGTEIITPETIRKVAKRDLKLIQKYMKALKSGSEIEIAKYEDIRPIDITEFIENKKKSLNYRGEIRLYKEAVKEKSQELTENVLITLTKSLITIHIPANVAEKAARQALDELGPDTKEQDLMKRAGEIAFTGAASSQKTVSKTKKGKKKPYSDECKLLNLVVQAREEKTSVYNKFQDNGYIKPPLSEAFLLGG